MDGHFQNLRQYLCRFRDKLLISEFGISLRSRCTQFILLILIPACALIMALVITLVVTLHFLTVGSIALRDQPIIRWTALVPETGGL